MSINALKCINVFKVGLLLSITAILNLTKSFIGFSDSLDTASLLYIERAFILSIGPIPDPFVYETKFLPCLLPGPRLFLPPILTRDSIFLVT